MKLRDSHSISGPLLIIAAKLDTNYAIIGYE